MTYVSTPQSGAFGRKGSRRFGPIVGAIAIVVAAGAAIAFGLAVNDSGTTTATESIYGNLEALKYEDPALQRADLADQVLRNRAPATVEPAVGATASQTAIIDELVRQGLVPADAIPKGQPDANTASRQAFEANIAGETAEPAPFYESPGQPR